MSAAAPRGRYAVVYADPPWSFRLWGRPARGRRTAESHYPTMPLPDLLSLPVRGLAAPDCCLFLWATMPVLPAAFQVMRAWGFEYRTCAFVWAKRSRSGRRWHFGMGYWTRANAELCLLGVRGRPRRVSAAVPQLIEAPVLLHSQKPAEARERIVELLGDLPRVELFARERAPGWEALGLEIDGRRLQESLPDLIAGIDPGTAAPAHPATGEGR